MIPLDVPSIDSRLRRYADTYRFDYLADTGEVRTAIYTGEGWTEAEARLQAGRQFQRDYPALRKA